MRITFDKESIRSGILYVDIKVNNFLLSLYLPGECKQWGDSPLSREEISNSVKRFKMAVKTVDPFEFVDALPLKKNGKFKKGGIVVMERSRLCVPFETDWGMEFPHSCLILVATGEDEAIVKIDIRNTRLYKGEKI